ncbi:hypothetical protein KC968_04710 [Candidatus Saccharibacteria bacterium]|nr:hypothetical protein [Candidatus Saccharibacteria bacterium]
MKRWISSAISIITIAVINTFTFGGLHAGAMSQQSMSGGMNHGSMSTKSVSCVSVCTTATVNRGDDLELPDKNEDDDEPSLPFSLTTSKIIASLEKQHSDVARSLVKYEPPPGIPLYIQFLTLRP